MCRLRVMAEKKERVIETGTFASPATGADSTYELVSDKDANLVVKCLSSGSEFDVSVLANPTFADIEKQEHAFRREIAAWLCTNGPENPDREQAAMFEVGQALQAHYTADELLADRTWIESNDLSKRIPWLRDGLPENERLHIVEFAARIGSAGTRISETDAQFIEVLGNDLGLSADVVTNTVVNAIHQHQSAA